MGMTAKYRDMGQRIQSARIEAGFQTADTFAEKLPVKVATVRSWEQGRSRPRHELLSLITDLTGKDTDYFYGRDGTDQAELMRKLSDLLARTEQALVEGVEPIGEFVLLPLLGQVSAGGGGIPKEHIKEWRHIPASFIPPGEQQDCFLIVAHGESMMDAGIEDGDLLLVSSSAPINDADIAILEVEGEAIVKRVFRRANGLLAVSANPVLPPFEVAEARIVGRVMKIIRDT